MDPRGSAELIHQIRTSAQTSTHMFVPLSSCQIECALTTEPPSVPHYHVVSRGLQAGRLNFVFFRMRAWLIEELYRRIGQF